MHTSPIQSVRPAETSRAAGDAPVQLTPDQAGRMAVAAVVADIDYWARTVAVDGRVGLNDLIAVLDLFRRASMPADAA